MKLEIRNGKIVIDGYVNAVERFSKPLKDKKGTFIEKIMSHVFQRAIEKADNILVLLNHDKNRVLADTKSKTAKLYEDNIGLRCNGDIEDAEVIKKGKEGKLRGWSFGFICKDFDSKINEDGIEERTIKELELIEVSIIDDRKMPAYSGTSIELRDSDIQLIEYRGGDFEMDETTPTALTSSQKRELLSVEIRKQFEDSWLEDYDDENIYVRINETGKLYKISYSFVDNKISINFDNKVEVIRGGYVEVAQNNQVPEQQSEKRVDDNYYSSYREKIAKFKEEEK